MISPDTIQRFTPQFEYSFSIALTLAPVRWIRPTTMGATRGAVYVTEGTVEGPGIKGVVIPMSGGDWPLVRPDGVIDFDARYLLELEDGTTIYMQNRGYRWAADPDIAAKMSRNEPVDPSQYYMRVSPKFDVPQGPHDWMARHLFVGIAEKTPGANRIHYYKLL